MNRITMCMEGATKGRVICLVLFFRVLYTSKDKALPFPEASTDLEAPPSLQPARDFQLKGEALVLVH